MPALRVLHRLFCSLCMLLASIGAAAQTDNATAEMMLRKSGAWEMLGNFGPQVKAGMADAAARAGTRPSAAEAERLERAIATAFAVDRLRSTSLATVAQGMDTRHLPALKQWMETPPGPQLTQMEEAFSARQLLPEAIFAQGGALLQAMPAPRRALLQQITDATDAAQLTAQIMVNTALAAHRGVTSMLPPGEVQVTEAQLRAALEQQRPQLLPTLSAMSTASLALAYVSAPSEDLQRYVDFLRSDAGQHFNALLGKALDAAMTDATTELGRRLPGTADRSNS